MAHEGVPHRLGMLLPEPRAALDVREEEGDRAGRQRRHVHALALRAMRLTLSDRRSAGARAGPESRVRERFTAIPRALTTHMGDHGRGNAGPIPRFPACSHRRSQWILTPL